MSVIRKISVIIFCCLSSISFAQNESQLGLTLNECINIALENNLDIQQFKLGVKSSSVDYKQSKKDILPGLNANYNLGVNDGRSIDPFTNSYINQELTFSNLGVNADLLLFNSFRNLNRIKQSKLNLNATEMELEEAKQDLTLRVTIGYIRILNSRDLIKLSESRMQTTERQLNRLAVNYKEGAGSPVEYTDMQGQYALDKTSLIDAKNSYKAAIVDFIRLLNIDTITEDDFNYISGLVASEKYPYSADKVYDDALENLATFKSKQFKIDAAATGIKVSRANYYPEISLFAQLNTNYSSLAESFTENGFSTVQTNGFVSIANQDYPVFENQTQFTADKISYEDQFNNNLSTVVGVAVRIPIFNRLRARSEVKLQKIRLEEFELDLLNTKQQFKQDIEKAYNNMETAYDRYFVLKEQVEAYEESYRINEMRFDNGVSNVVEYITSKNNVDIAQLNLNQARYEYLLRVKILEYYRGN